MFEQFILNDHFSVAKPTETLESSSDTSNPWHGAKSEAPVFALFDPSFKGAPSSGFRRKPIGDDVPFPKVGYVVFFPEDRHIPSACALLYFLVAPPCGTRHLLVALDKLWPKGSPVVMFDR